MSVSYLLMLCISAPSVYFLVALLAGLFTSCLAVPHLTPADRPTKAYRNHQSKYNTGKVMSVGFNATNTTELQRKALWNYFLVKNDGSPGIHNTRFAVEVLQATVHAVSGKPVPGAAKP